MEKQPQQSPGEETARMAATVPAAGEPEELRPVFAVQVYAAGDLRIAKSFAGYVSAGKDMALDSSRCCAAVAGSDMIFTRSGTRVAVTGRDLTLENGRAGIVKAGRDVHLTTSRAGILVGGQAAAHRSTIGVVLSRQVILDDSSRILISSSQAAILGAALGISCALARWLLQRMWRS